MKLALGAVALLGLYSVGHGPATPMAADLDPELQRAYKAIAPEGSFHMGSDKASNGSIFATMELKLQDPETGYLINVLVSAPKEAGPIGKGAYRVPSNLKGFIGSFDGVFAFVEDAKGDGATFFSRSGKIRVEETAGDQVKGCMQFVFYNDKNERLVLGGKFTAVRG